MHCIIYIYIISSPKLNTKYIDVNIYIYKNMYINIYLHDLGVNDQGYPAPRLQGDDRMVRLRVVRKILDVVMELIRRWRKAWNQQSYFQIYLS